MAKRGRPICCRSIWFNFYCSQKSISCTNNYFFFMLLGKTPISDINYLDFTSYSFNSDIQKWRTSSDIHDVNIQKYIVVRKICLELQLLVDSLISWQLLSEQFWNIWNIIDSPATPPEGVLTKCECVKPYKCYYHIYAIVWLFLYGGCDLI